jgi:uncharacterized membrane protein YphA (DoxX/SURF4 family)
MTTYAPERGGFPGVILLLLRLFLGGMFIFAATVKLNDPQGFSESVKAFKILPDHLAQLATFAVPWIEALCGVALVLGLWSRASALVIALLLAAFIAGIASVLSRGLSVSCGCFGKLQPFCSGPLGMCNIIQNAVLMVIGLLVAAFGGGLISLDRRMAGCCIGQTRKVDAASTAT